MTWDDYYTKINDWAVSTAVSGISSLEDIGAPDEIVDAINIIAFEDKKGAVRLLNKALQAGVKFSGENLVEILVLCGEESFRKALYQSADKLTAHDLEEMYGCIENDTIIDIAKRYRISPPEDLVDEYAEELCSDVNSSISWRRFYDAFYDWNKEFAIARSRAISDFGDEDEILEVVNELFGTDESEASAFIQRAINSGVQFGEENLVEISALCDAETTRQAVIASNLLLNEDSLEELYGNVDDDVIIEVAEMRNLQLPEAMRYDCEEDELDVHDYKWEIQSAINAADYAMQCLIQVQESMNTGSNISVIDMLSKSFVPSLLKYISLDEAESDIRIAQAALEDLNQELKKLNNNIRIQLRYGKISSVFDMVINSSFLDGIVHLQINKAQRSISRTIKQVENIRRELRALL